MGNGGGWPLPATVGVQSAEFQASLWRSCGERDEESLVPRNIDYYACTSRWKIPIPKRSIGSSRRGYLL